MKIRIREARESAGLAQNELAALIGVAPNTLHGYESGKHDPRSILLVKIASACNVTVDFLLGRDENKKPPANMQVAANKDEAGLVKDFRSCQPDSKAAIRLIAARIALADAPSIPEEPENLDELILQGLGEFLDSQDLPASSPVKKEA